MEGSQCWPVIMNNGWDELKPAVVKHSEVHHLHRRTHTDYSPLPQPPNKGQVMLPAHVLVVFLQLKRALWLSFR